MSKPTQPKAKAEAEVQVKAEPVEQVQEFFRKYELAPQN